MNDLTLLQIAYKEGRIGIVKLHIPSDIFMVVVCVAVTAEVSAGIVSAYICSENTGTFCPLRFLFRHDKVASYCSFKGLLCHTTAAVHSVWCKVSSFGTGFYCDAVQFADLSKRLADGDTLPGCDRPSLRKVPLDLFVYPESIRHICSKSAICLSSV